MTGATPWVTSDLDIRIASPSDASDVARLLAEFRDWWKKEEPTEVEIHASVKRIIAGADGEFLLAFAGDEPAGVCQLRFRWSVWTSAEDCWLEDLYVRDSARRAGIGRALIDAAIQHARERGCTRIELDVNEDNEAALALYRSCGFTTEPKPPGRTLFLARRLA